MAALSDGRRHFLCRWRASRRAATVLKIIDPSIDIAQTRF
jgi:hypothetical protein